MVINRVSAMDFRGSLFLLSIGVAFSGVLYYYISYPIFDICEFEKCPYCYGIDQCEQFIDNKITLKTDSVVTFIRNYVSVKNVFLASASGGANTVILKKLGHDGELNNLDKLVCSEISYDNMCNFSVKHDVFNYTEKIVTFLNNASEFRNFRSCSENTSDVFVKSIFQTGNTVVHDSRITNIWTILQVNVEPLMLQVRYRMSHLQCVDTWRPHYYSFEEIFQLNLYQIKFLLL